MGLPYVHFTGNIQIVFMIHELEES
jgi:hypothetical protein